jgi:hypothetical protein
MATQLLKSHERHASSLTIAQRRGPVDDAASTQEGRTLPVAGAAGDGMAAAGFGCLGAGGAE